MPCYDDYLDPCSECGGSARLVFEERKGTRAVYRIFAQCKQCGRRGKSNDETAGQAVSDWNGKNR